jgi:septum formation protein
MARYAGGMTGASPVTTRRPLVLASGSPTRAAMLRALGLDPAIEVPRLDEAAIRDAMVADGATPRDIADALAEAKARRVAGRHPGALVLGSDQVLEVEGRVLGKAADRAEAAAHLAALAGRTHRLLSAAVLYEDGRPVWRHVAVARLTLRDLTPAQIDAYLDRNWDTVRGSVGAYHIEGEGLRLMTRVEGDHFTILGLPLVELVNYLMLRGEIVP